MNEKLHYVAVTGIVRNQAGKYLICQRSSTEKAFPNKWCVPGGKIELSDFVDRPKDTKDHWFDVIELVLKREVREETNIEIDNIGYVSNLAFLHPEGPSVLIFSMHAEHASGEVRLNEPEELIDHAWVTADEAADYDLIENILEQIQAVDVKLNASLSKAA